nr:MULTISPECIES: pantothenate kinase [unclassified Coleofasciculus]
MNKSYLALVIGNSRLHWGWFADGTLQEAWDTDYFPEKQVEQLIQCWVSGVMPAELFPPVLQKSCLSPPLYLASVVPEQTKLWQAYPATRIISLDHLPLSGLYPTLGIDRALALLGAGETYGYPMLVIDAGTALTFTGVDRHRRLMGGAILPGLRLQLQSLGQRTAALPTTQLPPQLPSRWAMQTPAAIESGVIYTVLAGVQDFIGDWQSRFRGSQVAITGGDYNLLLRYWQAQYPDLGYLLIADPHLIFWGIRSVYRQDAFTTASGKGRKS